jgi:hypothetical protein
VARGVDDVDAVVAPQWQVVAAEVIVMPRSRSCSIQSIVRRLRAPRPRGGCGPYRKRIALGQGGLAGVDMGHDPDVPVSFERVCRGMSLTFLELSGLRSTPPAFPS